MSLTTIDGLDAKPRRGRGQPTKFDPRYVEEAEKLAKLGATDVEMADFWGVTEATLTNWKHAHPDFFASIKRGKILPDMNVADSLYKRATGYTHPAVKIFADPKSGAEQIVPYVEHYPPDTTAAIFWLKNRRGAQWQDRRDVTQTIDVNVTLRAASEDDLRAKLADLTQRVLARGGATAVTDVADEAAEEKEDDC